jgi:hypothetical protein
VTDTKYQVKLPAELRVFVSELADLTGKTRERAVADAIREAVTREAKKRGNRA